MNLRRLSTSAFAGALLFAAAGAAGRAEAQREGYTYLSYAQPDVLLVSSADEDVSAQINMPVLSGDSLVTGAGSRAEAVLADGNVVRVDGNTELRFERMARTYEADDDRDLLFLARGTAAVEVRVLEHVDLQVGAARERALRLDTDDATILAASRGLFRVDAGGRGTEVYVLAGRVEVQGRGGRAVVRAGEYVFVGGDSELEVDASTSPRDGFARFLEERRDRTDRRETTRYVSSDFAYDYDTASFDDYGSWMYVSRYGAYCWRPRVPLGWAPYALGYWRWAPAGLTWVSAEPWGWLPYHYGTWVYDALLGWLWIPGTDYSPAWVYWSYTPDWVGWCPIGYYATYYRHYRHPRSVVAGPSPRVYPHLRGHVAVGQIDAKGWHYVAARRLGVRLDPAREILRGARVPFRPGEIAVIATAPLRFERGGNPATSIRDAIRRIPIGSAAPIDEGLTAVLRRDRTLTPAAQDELRRSIVRAGQDPAYRQAQAPLENPRGPDRNASADSWRQGIDRGTTRGPSAFEGPLPRDASSAPRDRGASRRRDEGWRSPSSPPPAPIQRRADRPGRPDDSGWRAPQPRVIERDRAHDAPPSRQSPVREAPRAAPPAPASPRPSAPAPAPQRAPAPPPARREGAFRMFDRTAHGAPLHRA